MSVCQCVAPDWMADGGEGKGVIGRADHFVRGQQLGSRLIGQPHLAKSCFPPAGETGRALAAATVPLEGEVEGEATRVAPRVPPSHCLTRHPKKRKSRVRLAGPAAAP